MSMTIGELRDYLDNLISQEESMADVEVRLAIQPNWPFQHSIGELPDTPCYVLPKAPDMEAIFEVLREDHGLFIPDGSYIEYDDEAQCYTVIHEHTSVNDGIEIDGPSVLYHLDEYDMEALRRVDLATGILYIPEGGQISESPYLPEGARKQLGW